MEDDILVKEDGVLVCPSEAYRDRGSGGEESPSTEIF